MDRGCKSTSKGLVDAGSRLAPSFGPRGVKPEATDPGESPWEASLGVFSKVGDALWLLVAAGDVAPRRMSATANGEVVGGLEVGLAGGGGCNGSPPPVAGSLEVPVSIMDLVRVGKACSRWQWKVSTELVNLASEQR